ncbi:MAG: ABC transporter ATP-binding protein [Actinomycetota bacterium]|nr:ABC transporter ATP-binding protein [Actinomycetota bacterium]
MTLEARVRTRRGQLELSVELNSPPREVVAILGPNGAGKTTLLRVVAGLHPLTGGRLTLGGTTLDDPAAGIRIPVERRPIGMVFQDYLLFPHLSALDNVSFGLRARGVDRATARRRAGEELARLGLVEQAVRRPGALSGGQAQRVALARALVTEPAALLLDEPLSALDAATRAQVRSQLRHDLRAYGGVVLLVTHDPLDAMVLGDRIVVLEGGRVVQSGHPAEVARRPRTSYVAELVNVNLYSGIASGTRVRLDGGGTLESAEPIVGAVLVNVAPTAITLRRSQPPAAQGVSIWSGSVASVEEHGLSVRVRLEGQPPALVDVPSALLGEIQPVPGSRLWMSVAASNVLAYPR